MFRSRPSGATLVVCLACLAALLGPVVPGSASAQEPGSDRLRVGVSLGGVSFVGFDFEYRWGDRSVDLTVGTWTLRDVSLSVVAKQYLGPGGLRPFFGIGLWGVTAFPAEGTGAALVLRAPVGVDWRVVSEHYLGAAMNINRGLWVRRTDPTDDTPLNRRLVPLPGFYYRWQR